jgi:beta-lactamase class A
MSARRRARLARTVSGALAVVVVVAVLSQGSPPQRVAAGSPSPSAPATEAPSGASGPTQPTATAKVHRFRLFSSRPVTRYLAAHSGHVTAAVFDRATRRLYVYRPHVAMIAASIVKVDILATLLARAQALGGHLGAHEEYLCRQMIDESDNGAAQALWELLGDGEYVRRFNIAARLTETRLGGGHWGTTTTSAADQVHLIQLIGYPNPVLSRSSRAYALDLMTHVDPSQAWGVSAGVSPRAIVALKNGWLPADTGWQVNSVGLVHGRGRNYAIAVLVDGATTQAAGIQTIEGLSRLVWKQLAPLDDGAPSRRMPAL